MIVIVLTTLLCIGSFVVQVRTSSANNIAERKLTMRGGAPTSAGRGVEG